MRPGRVNCNRHKGDRFWAPQFFFLAGELFVFSPSYFCESINIQRMSMNDIQLHRKDLYQATCITGKSLGLLPPGDSKKKCFRVVVGADNGILTCFRIKKGEAEVEFTTVNLDYPVSRLITGGPVGQSRVFFTSAQTIRGVTRKGKEFFRFNTDGAEVLRGLHVEDTKIWTSGEYIFNYYIDTKDAGHFVSRDRINDLLVVPIFNMVDHNAILACQDRYVRVLDVSKLHYEAFVEGAVTSLVAHKDSNASQILGQAREKGVLFGTDSGLVGELRMSSSAIKPGWLQQNTRGLGAVTAIVSHDLTKNGTDDIIVARDDGEIQVFGLEDTGANGIQPVQLLSKSINECVQGLQVGTISTSTFDEVAVAA
jgi:Bardet-Biedl syndrome 7 protein